MTYQEIKATESKIESIIESIGSRELVDTSALEPDYDPCEDWASYLALSFLSI